MLITQPAFNNETVTVIYIRVFCNPVLHFSKSNLTGLIFLQYIIFQKCKDVTKMERFEVSDDDVEEKENEVKYKKKAVTTKTIISDDEYVPCKWVIK